MLAPNILSTTVGMSLPSYDITREIVKPDQACVRAKHRTSGSVKPVVSHYSFAWLGSRVMMGVLVILNILCFGFYIYNVNNLQASQYSLLTSQEQVRTLQDKSRQLQVRIAASTSVIRSQQLVQANSEFVTVGTPEFIGKSSTTVLTMR